MRRRIILYAGFIILVVVMMDTVNAFPGQEARDSIRQFEFAEHLFNEGEYFRAIGEYKRFIFLYPESFGCIEESWFKIALSYYRATRWEEAITALRKFIELFPESLKRGEAEYLKGTAEHSLGRHQDALDSFNWVIRFVASELKSKALFESALVRVDMRDWEKAGELLSMISEDSVLFHSATIFSEGLDRIEELPRKSPATAGTLAALLPGAGHVYTENYRDGLVAFLLNGLFIAAAVELFDRGDDIAGGIVTFFELGWYTGNIYSAVGSAHKFNKVTEDRFLRSLKARTSLSFLQDRDRTGRFLVLNISF